MFYERLSGPSLKLLKLNITALTLNIKITFPTYFFLSMLVSWGKSANCDMNSHANTDKLVREINTKKVPFRSHSGKIP